MNRRSLLVGIPAAILDSSLSFGLSRAYAGPDIQRLAVVVGKDSAQRDLSLSALKALFKGQIINGASGGPLVPFNFKPKTSLRVAFDELVLGMDPDEAARYWIDRKIRGQRGAPKSVPSSDVLRLVLSKMSSAIGYVPPHEVGGPMRAITIDGKMPGDAGYPLQP